MKTIKSVLFMGGILVSALLAPTVYGQSFTFYTIAGGLQGSNDGVGAAAQFYTPSGVALDAAGNVYVADRANNMIREITPSGTNWIVTTIAGGAQGSRDGTNRDAQFSAPTGLAIDPYTNIYVADQDNYTIRKMTPSGTNWVVTTIAGQAGVFGLQDGTSALFYNPVGLALDSSNNIFVADEYNNAIRMVSSNGGAWTVTTLAGGTPGSSNGVGTNAQFFKPSGVAVDSNDNIFVADQFNNLIRLVTPEGSNWVVTTIAGQGTVGDIDGTNAAFDDPVGVALDANENLYVADFFNNAIRELTLTGSNWDVVTIDREGLNGISNAPATNFPFGIATDTYGDIFVTDSGNNSIRMGVSSAAAPATGSLEVTLTPPAAVTAGAQWQLDGGTRQTSGTTLTNLTPGTHTVTFSFVTNFTEPAYQTVVVTAHQTTSAIGNYPTAIPNKGSLEVLISPAAAVDDGAEWQVDDGLPQTNGAIVANLSIGDHTLTFASIAGWTAPVSQTVVVANSLTTLGLGTYTLGSASSNDVFILTASPTNGGTVSGGGSFTLGTTQTVTATANTNYIFTNWTVNGTVVSLSTNYTFLVTSNETLVANFLPLYLLTVTASPSSEGAATAGTTLFPEGNTATVAATANSGDEFVAWTGEGTGTSNQLAVNMTTNISVQANFAVAGAMTLTVITNGQGTITPPEGGKTLKKGATYTLRATPKTGYLFLNWTGSLTTNRNPLPVKLETAMVLQANFIPNQFLETKGTYNGLFTVSNAVTEQTAGMIRGLTIAQTGRYSGSVVINGASHGFSGAFSPLGLATNNINRSTAQGGPLTVVLTVSGTDAPEVTGTVSGSSWVADLIAYRGATGVAVADYNLLIEPDTNNAPPTSSPGGDGYASIVTAATTTRITGSLADGTAFSETVPVSAAGYVPLFASLYANQGLILGWINLYSTNATNVSFTWIHPVTRTGLYRTGFTNVLQTNQILLSPWTDSTGNFETVTNVTLLDTINDTNSMGLGVTTVASGKITGASVNGSVNPKTGVFKFTIDSGGSKSTGYGAILPALNTGGGYYLTPSAGQGILLKP